MGGKQVGILSLCRGNPDGRGIENRLFSRKDRKTVGERGDAYDTEK